jgi:threonine/homoserine/homoserine lactone efflux protein
VALFFLAFLPQFIVPDAPGQAMAFLVLGALFDVSGTAVNVGVALLASGMSRRWSTQAGGRAGRWLQRAAGVMFVGLGVKLAISSR